MSWIFFTIAATIFQTFRNLEQKHLNQKLDSLSVTWSRFILPLPLALIVVLSSFSSVNKSFILTCFIVSVFQAAGNIFILQTFKSKNFSIGITFYKTEILQAMVIGALVFNQTMSAVGVISIAIATIGAILMSDVVFRGGVSGFIKSLSNKAALFGLAAGFSYSVSAFSLKVATSELTILEDSNISSGALILMWVIFFQNISFALIKIYQKRLTTDLALLFSLENKNKFIKTAIFSFLGSLCWFIAYSIGEVVYVKAVGQVELIMAIVVSNFILKERNSLKDLIGIFLTSVGILLLIFFG